MGVLDKQKFIDFNKELFFGELGGLAGTQSFSHITSEITTNPKFISLSIVVGAVVGAIFWLSMRIYHKKKEKNLSVKSMTNDVIYFTPAAFLLSVIVYYPVLYYFSYYLLVDQYRVFSSVLISQGTAFLSFLISINIYRLILKRFYNKVL